jgi:EAL domain-containing protein (putative c-di-GMP-specific phosphodiesterase class I)
LVVDVLEQTGLAPELLELEVTEGALMENSAATRAALQELRDHGVRIALDDFGTGYSSLAYLTRMPIGNIKVDRCFVAGLLDGGENEAIVRAVLAMAGSLGMRVTAEGVETIEQALALKSMACDSLQGFYFSRPVPADRIPALLSRRWPLDVAEPSELGSSCAGTLKTSTTAR